MHTYDPGRDETHTMAYHQGRVFFFALGHDKAVLENPSFQEVVRRGALWVGKRL